MVQRDDLASISNDDLLTTAQRLTERANVALADLLSHLGEIERRGIHRQRACAELQTRALRALVQQLRERKRAATKVSSPTPTSSSPAAERRSRIVSHAAPERAASVPDASPERASVPDASPARAASVADAAPERRGARHIPASVRRAVFERDCGRCAYHDDRGERCPPPGTSQGRRETFGLEVHHRHAHALGGPATLDNLQLRCRPHNALAAEEDFGQKYMESCGTVRMTRISP